MNLDQYLKVPDYFIEYLNMSSSGSFKFININYNNSKYSIDGKFEKYNKKLNYGKYVNINYTFKCDSGNTNYSFIFDLDEELIILGDFDTKSIIPFKSLFIKCNEAKRHEIIFQILRQI